MEAKPTQQSYVHWGGALVFCMFARFHADGMISIYDKLKHDIPEITATLSFKKQCIEPPIHYLFIMGIVAQISIGQKFPVMLNIMGLVQWIIIG